MSRTGHLASRQSGQMAGVSATDFVYMPTQKYDYVDEVGTEAGPRVSHG